MLLAGVAFLRCGSPDPARAGARGGGAYGADGRWTGSALRWGARPNVVLVVLDTLRADALTGRDGRAPAMPGLAGLAARHAHFTEAVAPAPWTLPSMTSLLTGVLPSVHGVTSDTGQARLPAARTTFAEILQSSYGYQTAAFLGLRLGEGPGSVLAGFERVSSGFALQGAQEHLAPWARERDPARPFLLLLHTFEAHHPYGAANHPYPEPDLTLSPSGPDPIEALGPDPAAAVLAELLLTNLGAARSLTRQHAERMSSQVIPFLWRGLADAPDAALAGRLHAAYEEGVAWVDGLLAATVEGLRGLGLLEDTVLVITADHGEAFGEHGHLMHGRQLYDEVLRVPLVIAGPPPFEAPRRWEGPVGLIDVLPTVLDLLEAPALPGIDGRSLLPALRGGGTGDGVVLSEEWIRPGRVGEELCRRLASVRSGRWKVILTRDLIGGSVAEEAYDLEADPGERAPRARSAVEVDALELEPALRDALGRVRARVDAEPLMRVRRR